MLAISPSDTVLDVGTGTGGLLREVERRGLRPARSIGLDTSDSMLARARSALPARTELLCADARALPLAGATVDVATSAYLLHLLRADARAEALHELHRVLVPGGRLDVITVAPPARRLTRIISVPLRAAAERSHGLLAGLRPLDPGDDLRAAGFEVDAVRRVRGGYPSLCVRATRGRARAESSGQSQGSKQ